VREERLLATALAACGLALVLAAGGIDRTLGAWVVVLAMQAMPYAAALICNRIGHVPSATPLQPAANVASVGDGPA
jgi:ribose/xylose/arabinose/galactoside ABC-type transport system permease subunit